MAKFLAFFTGLILSLMITFNGLLSSFTSTYISNVVYQVIGLVFFGIVLLFLRKNKSEFVFKWQYLIPGFLGSIIIIINNVVLNVIGVTLMVAFTLVGQVITSIIIDHWGLLGVEISRSNKKQWLGVVFMIVGLTIMII